MGSDIMKVILLKDVGGVGRRDEIKEVADGYGINFLIAGGSAVQATPEQMALQERHVRAREAVTSAENAKHSILVSKLQGATVTIKEKANEQGKLYHQVSSFQIASEINRKFHANVRSDAVVINDPIREKGVHSIEVHVGRKVIIMRANIEA
jgi:large subunit ribosomal protein L9